jgi:hypothetical protein
MSESIFSSTPAAEALDIRVRRRRWIGKRIQELELIYRRTFLSWLHFAVVLGGLAVGLLNFGDKVSSLDFLMETTKLTVRSARSPPPCTLSSVSL